MNTWEGSSLSVYECWICILFYVYINKRIGEACTGGHGDEATGAVVSIVDEHVRPRATAKGLAAAHAHMLAAQDLHTW
jgi:hypothetical protein